MAQEGHRAGRPPARDGILLNRLAGRAILPALPTKPLPAGSGTGSRGRGERSEGGRGRRRERSVATQERSFATGGGSVPTQRRAQRPGRAPGMASRAGRRPTKPPGGGKGGESNLPSWAGRGPCPPLAAASLAAARGGQSKARDWPTTKPHSASKGRGAPCWTGRRGGRTGAVRLAPKPRTATRQPGAPPPAPLTRPAQAGARSATGSPGAAFS